MPCRLAWEPASQRSSRPSACPCAPDGAGIAQESHHRCRLFGWPTQSLSRVPATVTHPSHRCFLGHSGSFRRSVPIDPQAQRFSRAKRLALIHRRL